MNGSLPDPILPHTMVRIIREHLCRFEVILMKLHLKEFEYVVLGHTPQFEVLIKYCTPDNMFVAMEFHVKVSWSVLISKSVIFGEGKESTGLKIILCNCSTEKFYNFYLIVCQFACCQ